MHAHTHIYKTIIKEKDATNLKENQVGKEKGRNFIIIISERHLY